MRLFTRYLLQTLAILTVALSFGSVTYGQTIVGPNTVTTGQCYARQNQPGCVLPDAFGPNGLTLAVNPQIPHFAHFIGDAQTTLNQTLSSSIATQLAILPIISPASGFTYRYDRASGAFVRTSDSFGPVYSERAQTIGRGKVSVGVSYQHFDFSTLDGIDLHNIPAVFTHIGPPNGTTVQPFNGDVIATANNINLTMNQTTVYATVGLTNRFDVSVAVPFASVTMSLAANATIDRVSGNCFSLIGIPASSPGCPAGQVGNPHAFLDGTLNHTYLSSGSASGVGDVTLRFKGTMYQSDRFNVAAAMDLRTPSGSALRFLGSGAWGVKPFVAISAGKRFSPHANFGYQWNGKSILAGDVTGSQIGEDASGNVTILNGDPIKNNLPSQLLYSGGIDIGVTKNFTVAFDYLGQTLFNAPRVVMTTLVTQNITGSNGTTCPAAPGCSLPTIAGVKENVELSSGSIGAKYNLFGNLLITGDLLFRMDDHGLRQTVTPLVAVSYAFGR